MTGFWQIDYWPKVSEPDFSHNAELVFMPVTIIVATCCNPSCIITTLPVLCGAEVRVGERQVPGWQPRPLPDVVTGSKDEVTVARRMITGLEKQTGPLRVSAWALATGRAELPRQWKQWWNSLGRQPGDRRDCLGVWPRCWRNRQKHLGWWLGENRQDHKSQWIQPHSGSKIKGQAWTGPIDSERLDAGGSLGGRGTIQGSGWEWRGHGPSSEGNRPEQSLTKVKQSNR